MRCGAQVFATCGSERKRRYLLDTFPGLRADHIGDSRSTSFEGMIKHLVRMLCVQANVFANGNTNQHAGSRGKGMLAPDHHCVTILLLNAKSLALPLACPYDFFV